MQKEKIISISKVTLLMKRCNICVENVQCNQSTINVKSLKFVLVLFYFGRFLLNSVAYFPFWSLISRNCVIKSSLRYSLSLAWRVPRGLVGTLGLTRHCFTLPDGLANLPLFVTEPFKSQQIITGDK